MGIETLNIFLRTVIIAVMGWVGYTVQGNSIHLAEVTAYLKTPVPVERLQLVPQAMKRYGELYE